MLAGCLLVKGGGVRQWSKDHMQTHTLLTAQLGGIHSLAKHLDGHPTCLLQTAVLLVVLLEQALGTRIVGADTGGLPTAIVARGVAEVELELALGVPAGVDERYSEGPETSVLGVALLEIAQAADELLAGYVLVVGQQVALGVLAGEVDEDVGIGRHAGYGADHVVVENV